MTIILDSGPLGMLCAPPGKSGVSAECRKWLVSLIGNGHRIIIPEIADYEVRRELLRAQLDKSVTRLDSLILSLEYLPLTTSIMRSAAAFWALARQTGNPTAGDKNIDADMILVAQAIELGVSNYVIATTNVGHLGRFAVAQEWQDIVVS